MSESNLPVSATPFVGRNEELSDIALLLADSTCRLLTLVGPGGIGKTRLALEAAEQTTSFHDGIYFISLQALHSPDHIISALASVLNFQFYPGGESKQQLLSFLRNKHLLLLLDNFEHLLEGADLVSDLLSTAPAVQIIVTSRERLNLSSETVFQVAGLPVPSMETAQHVLRYSAVQLFIQRARRVHRDFSAEAADLNGIAHICRLVGGMPLAILLAAAWVDLLSLQEIAAEIERGLEFLETEMRDLPERHRSVRATFDSSWRRLSEIERDVFKKLSIFRGGFSREAAQVVAGASLKTLMRLVDKSFLQTIGSGRYELHELLRQYGVGLLNASAGESDTVRGLHAAYYAEFMRQRQLDFMGANVKAPLRAVGADYDNIRLAWDETVRHSRWADLWKLAHSFFDFSWHLNRMEDALNPYAQAVTKLEEVEESEKDDELLACLLGHQAFIAVLLAKPFDPNAYQRAVTLMSSHPPSNPVAAHGLSQLGFCAAHRVALPDGERLMRDSISLCRTRGYRYQHAESIIYLMVTFSNLNVNWAEMKVLNEEVFDLLKPLKSAVLLTLARRQQGIILFEEGNYAGARQLFTESFLGFQEDGDLIDAMACQDYLGAIAYKEGDYTEALYHFRQLLIAYSETIGPFHIPYALDAIAENLVAQGKHERAVELCIFFTLNPHESLLGAAPPGIAPLLEQLERELPADTFAAALERGKALDRDAMIRDLLAELSQPESPPVLQSLSKREREVATLIALGKSNTEIAGDLVLSKRTVEKHIANILSKLDFTHRAQIVRWAFANGLSDAS